MIASANEDRQSESIRRQRPLGVWVLTVCHTVYAALGIFGWSQGSIGSIPHGWSQATVEQAPYIVVLFVGLLASTWGAWLGNRHARVLLLSLLTIAIGLSLREVLLSVWTVSGEASRNPEQWRSALLWSATTGLALLLWLVLNYWYFLGKRTRHFYAAVTDGGKGSI